MGSRLGPAAPVAAERLDQAGANILYLTGLAARQRAPQTIVAAAAILDRTGVDWTMLSEEIDTGLDLWELGYPDAAADAARRFATVVRALRPGLIVTGSASDPAGRAAVAPVHRARRPARDRAPQ